MYGVMAYKQKRKNMLSVRASDEEVERFRRFAKRVIKHHPYMTEADVLRELIGLIDTGLITPRMRLELLDPEYHVNPPESDDPPLSSREQEETERVRRDAEATLAVLEAQSERKSSRRKKSPEAA
jgi:hypothetical protein